MTVLEIVFWVALGLIVYSQFGYPLVLWMLQVFKRSSVRGTGRPAVSLIVAAHNEQDVIADKVANALALDYPRDKLQVVVASDGSTDATAERARAAGADLVLELERAGKVPAQNAAVAEASGELLAFSDANSAWQPDALAELAAAFGDSEVGYACGRLQLTGGGDNQEGLYWRYEMKLREMESGLAGVTAGNGAIYMTRRESYIELDPARSHDGSFPFMLAKRGLRSLDVPGAVASEPMASSIGDEFARKRRIMRPLWDVVVLDGMLSPRGYSPLYAFEIFSHRLLRYAAPLLHLTAFAANIALLGDGTVYAVTLVAQLAVLAAAALASVIPIAPFRIARYYVSVTTSVIAGLWDRFRQGPRSAGWETVR